VAEPIFWLGLSLLLVAVSLTAVLIAALPALQELARAARSAEKLFDTLNRELPPTLEAIRLTGLEISNLTDDMSEGVQGAGRIVRQVDDSIRSVKKQARKAQVSTRSLVAGVKAAWKVLSGNPTSSRRTVDRFLPAETHSLDLDPAFSDRNLNRASESHEDSNLASYDNPYDSYDYSQDSSLDSYVELEDYPLSSPKTGVTNLGDEL